MKGDKHGRYVVAVEKKTLQAAELHYDSTRLFFPPFLCERKAEGENTRAYGFCRSIDA
jgi:hypothetical protein